VTILHTLSELKRNFDRKLETSEILRQEPIDKNGDTIRMLI